MTKVSVIVPVRDGEKTIGACLRSVLAACARVDGAEVVVVDDGSSDRTGEIAATFPVPVVQAIEGRGSYYARNVGASLTRGTVLAFTDADCEVDSSWLEAGLAAFADPGVGVAGGIIEAAPVSTRPAWYQSRIGALRQELSMEHGVLPYAQTANLFVRRGAYQALGGFDETFESGGDADFCWRLQRATSWRLVFQARCRVLHHHRDAWRGVFAQAMRNARGRLALEQKHHALYTERSICPRSSFGLFRALTYAGLGLGVRTGTLAAAALSLQPERVWLRYGDLVRSVAYHTVLCGTKLRVL